MLERGIWSDTSFVHMKKRNHWGNQSKIHTNKRILVSLSVSARDGAIAYVREGTYLVSRIAEATVLSRSLYLQIAVDCIYTYTGEVLFEWNCQNFEHKHQHTNLAELVPQPATRSMRFR
jgi:hypothetical protein